MKFDSIVALRLAPAPSTPNEFANVLGYTNPGDGGFGDFYWDAASTATTVNGIIEQASGGGTGRWKRLITSAFNVKWFGAKGDNATDDSTVFQTAIDFVSATGGGSLYIPSGTYIVKQVTLKSGVFIKGAGLDNVYLDCKDTNYVLASPNPVETSVTLTADIKTGDNVFSISGTVAAGNFIRLLSNRSCNSKFYPAGPIRPYYLEGEMFKVLSVSGSLVTVEGRSFYNFPVSDMQAATVFSPAYGGGITDVTLICNQSVDKTDTQGLIVRGHESFEIGSLKAMHFNKAGVSVTKSYLTVAKYILSRGGSDVPQLNYGLVIEDGSKYTSVERVSGNGNRHAVAGGGSGWAISMYNHINFVTHTKEVQTDHGVDTHANTANWSFGSIYSSNGISMSGTGHTVNAAMCLGGQNYIAYEGGDQLYFGNIQHLNPQRCYNQYGMVDTVVERMSVTFENSLSGSSVMQWGRNSKNLRVNELRYINNAIDTAANDTAANSLAPEIILYANNSYGKLDVKGFKYLWLAEDNISIEKLHTADCGWTSAVPSGRGVLWIDTNAKQTTIGEIISEAGLSNLTFNSTYIQFENAAGGSDVSIKNVEERGSKQYSTAINCSNQWSDVSLENIEMSGTITFQATGSYVENVNGLVDTLPVTGQIIFSGNGSNKTFNIPHGQGITPVYFDAKAASAAANGLFYVTANATNIIVEFATAPASGTNNVVLNWDAKFER